MGVGGGVILVPAMVYLLRMDQHTAQGTSLFLQLPPLGLGALVAYWKKGQVDLNAGLICALGFLLGGYFGSKFAIGASPKHLHEMFGMFLIVAAALLWYSPHSFQMPQEKGNSEFPMRLFLILLMACGVGVAGGFSESAEESCSSLSWWSYSVLSSIARKERAWSRWCPRPACSRF